MTASVEEWKRRYETARLAHEEVRAEKAALQTEIERLRELNDEQQAEMLNWHMQLTAKDEEIARLRSERHITKEMLEDVLRRHGLKTSPYGPGSAGQEKP
jgi:chromosome segregation ATPase